jgi:hypothetical protein
MHEHQNPQGQTPWQLYLFPWLGTWNCETISGNEEEVRALFGTNILPTPFTTELHGELVATRIERLNPGAHVDWFSTLEAWRAEGGKLEAQQGYGAAQ